MDSSDSRYIDAINAKEFHLFGVEPTADQIHAGGEPLIRWFALFKSNIAPGIKLGH